MQLYNMTNYDRLMVELNHKMYLPEDDYKRLLEENGLIDTETYSREDRLKLLNTVLSIFQILANDVDLYRSVQTEFATTGEAITAINTRITRLKSEISQIEAENEAASGPVSYLFRGRC